MFDVLFVALLQAAAGDPQPTVPTESAPPAASAPEQQAQPAAPSEDQRQAANERRCRTQVVTGSRLGARVCRTRSEEAREREDSRRMVEGMQRTTWPEP